MQVFPNLAIDKFKDEEWVGKTILKQGCSFLAGGAVAKSLSGLTPVSRVLRDTFGIQGLSEEIDLSAL